MYKLNFVTLSLVFSSIRSAYLIHKAASFSSGVFKEFILFKTVFKAWAKWRSFFLRFLSLDGWLESAISTSEAWVAMDMDVVLSAVSERLDEGPGTLLEPQDTSFWLLA